MPDLVLIDGGVGQLNAAMAALDSLGLDLPIAALAKREEQVWLPAASEPLRLDRFGPRPPRAARDPRRGPSFCRQPPPGAAIETNLSSQLLAVPGIGPGRARALLNRFGSVRGVQQATVEELQRALGPRLGTHLWHHLHAGESSTEE